MDDRLQTLSADDFEPWLERAFTIRFGDGTGLPVTLAEVRRLGPAAPGASRAPFAIVFQAPGKGYVPQQVLGLEHEVLGAVELFFVPLGPAPSLGGMRYEAILS